MFELIIIAFIVFCFYKAYTLHKAKKQQQADDATTELVTPIHPEPIAEPPPSDTIQHAELERKTAIEKELASSESARQALKEINEKKKAQSRTEYYDPWDDDDIDDELTCIIRYSNEIGESSVRRIEPINVRLNNAGNWTVFAFDYSVSDSRTFRIDRIVYLEHMEELYTDFDEILKFFKRMT